jgi:anti-sigma regulatory factor (Ser/Thr protein kinase)
VTIPARALLLLYTDGLVERRRCALDDGIARVCDLLQEGRASALEKLANQVMSGLAPRGGYQDDVALLLYRHPAPLQLDFPADVDQLAGSRAALRSWLTRVQVTPEQVHDVLIAAGEAVANAIEHGHRDRPDGVISLRAIAFADQIRVTIVDTGAWKPPRPAAEPHRGRGVTLMRALMHDVTIESASSGTTVQLSATIT